MNDVLKMNQVSILSFVNGDATMSSDDSMIARILTLPYLIASLHGVFEVEAFALKVFESLNAAGCPHHLVFALYMYD